MQKKQRAATVSSLPWMACTLFGSSPDPCYWFKWNRGFGVRASARGVDANHCIFLGAECAKTGLVDRKRSRHNRITGVDATHNRARARSGLEAALAAASEVTVVGEHGVNRARGRRIPFNQRDHRGKSLFLNYRANYRNFLTEFDKVSYLPKCDGPTDISCPSQGSDFNRRAQSRLGQPFSGMNGCGGWRLESIRLRTSSGRSLSSGHLSPTPFRGAIG
jgi:hypothetical protein